MNGDFNNPDDFKKDNLNQNENSDSSNGETAGSQNGYSQSQNGNNPNYPYGYSASQNSSNGADTGSQSADGSNAGQGGYYAGSNNYASQGGYNGGQNGYNAGQNYSGSTQDPNYSPYGGNVQYKWNYDDYQKALNNNGKKPKSRRGLKPFLITVCSVFGVAVLGLAVVGISSLTGLGNIFSGGSSTAADNTSAPSISITNQPESSSTTTGKILTAQQVAQKVTPAVVGVVIYNLSSVEPTAEGSGIVMTSDGYIITNAHVISGAQKIRIVMSNGKTYDTVKTVGQDTKSDLAVLKIDAKGLTTATFGDSAKLKVGQDVIAIGNPGGLTLASTVTNGIVSGLNRTVDSSSNMTFIQTNALINPGNSGGPLVNMYGQVVGITSSKIEETGYEGIGFAIPISNAKPIIDSITKNGYVTGRVKVGVSVYPLSNSQAKWYNYPSGLYVESIDQTCDAYKKGVRSKDIITKINGISIASDDASTVYNTFYKEETQHKVGETVALTIYRSESGNTLNISVKLEEDKGDSSTSSSSDDQSQSGNSNSYGNSYGNSNGNGNDNSNSDGNSDSSSFWSNFGN